MHQVETTTPDTKPDELLEFSLFMCSEHKVNPYKVEVNINTVPVVMKLDTGASAIVIDETVYQKLN